MQEMLYGFGGTLISVAVVLLCTGVKAICRKQLRRGLKNEDR